MDLPQRTLGKTAESATIMGSGGESVLIEHMDTKVRLIR